MEPSAHVGVFLAHTAPLDPAVLGLVFLVKKEVA